VKAPQWEDPSRVEVGQAWDFDSDGEYMLVIVVETRDVDAPKHPFQTRRNANVYVVQDVLNEGPGHYEGRIIGYSEKHLRRNFRRVS
jgi:hypothetical protein